MKKPSKKKETKLAKVTFEAIEKFAKKHGMDNQEAFHHFRDFTTFVISRIEDQTCDCENCRAANQNTH